ncbi:lysozyme-like [Ochlerotatus camptorhynchus]|uniref:lysozyme-like n=1 Tax=Ochlerotatus camptorhynchus TaxID=644619 RepID=UPI0031DC7106
MMKTIAFIIAIAAVCTAFGAVEAKTFTECELAKLLRSRYNFDKNKVNNFVCMAKAESSLTTNKTNRNKNGSTDYGLFQINNNYWCSSPGHTSKNNDCKVSCSDLMTNDITKAVTCANKVFARHGYSAWNGWKSKCQNGVKDLSYCM